MFSSHRLGPKCARALAPVPIMHPALCVCVCVCPLPSRKWKAASFDTQVPVIELIVTFPSSFRESEKQQLDKENTLAEHRVSVKQCGPLVY